MVVPCRTDVSKLKFEGKTFYVIGIQKEVSLGVLTHALSPLKFENELYEVVSSTLMMSCGVMYLRRHHHADLLEPLTFVEF